MYTLNSTPVVSFKTGQAPTANAAAGAVGSSQRHLSGSGGFLFKVRRAYGF